MGPRNAARGPAGQPGGVMESYQGRSVTWSLPVTQARGIMIVPVDHESEYRNIIVSSYFLTVAPWP
jgi:hypothetical protein